MSSWTPPECEDQFDVHQRQARARRVAAMARGEQFSVLAELGIMAIRPPMLGDSRGVLLRELRVEEQARTQKTVYAVAVDAGVVLSDGRRLEAGDAIDASMLGGPDESMEDRWAAFAELRRLGVVSSIEPRTAFERSMPSDVEFMVFEPFEHGGHHYQRGEVVDPSMFPDPEVSSPTELELGLQAIRRDLGLRAAPPAVSLWRTLLSDGNVVRNPNYQAAHSGKKVSSK